MFKNPPSPNRLYATSFVETTAPGGFPPSATALLTDKKSQLNQRANSFSYFFQNSCSRGVPGARDGRFDRFSEKAKKID